MWNVEYTDEFNEWWDDLTEHEQKAVAYSVRLLIKDGPLLVYPYSSSIKTSKHSAMRELRSQCEGRPLRTFYMLDPNRSAILLIGGDKTGDKRFYETMIPKADKIYDDYLKEIKEEKI